MRRGKGNSQWQPGFEISAKFRRNSAKNFVFASYREKNFGIFRKISVLKFKIQKNLDKIHRNFGMEFCYRRSPGFGKKNEIVNPAEDTMTKTWS